MNDKSMLNDLLNKVRKIEAGGEANFSAAFDKISDNLESLREEAGEIASVSIAFLTEGQTQNDKSQLKYALSKIFEPYKKVFKIIVHSIGFSNDCDKELLEKMRTAGTEEGTFRCAEPGDNSDALCNILTDIFSLSEKSSTIKIHVSLPNELEFLDGNTNSKDCFIHVDAFSKAGTLNELIISKSSEQASRYVIIIDSSEDNHKEVPSLYKTNIPEKKIIEEHKKFHHNFIEVKIYIDLNDIDTDIILFNTNKTSGINVTMDNKKINLSKKGNQRTFKFQNEGEFIYQITFDFDIIMDNMMGFFDNCENIYSVDLSNFDSSNVIDMGLMFNECYALEEIVGLNYLNTKKVTKMDSMFHGCENLINLDLSSFNTSNVTDMSFMFAQCINL